MPPSNRDEIPALLDKLRRVMEELRDLDGQIPA